VPDSGSAASQGIAERRPARTVAPLAEDSESISISSAERDRNDVVDLELARLVRRDSIEPEADHPVHPDVVVDQSLAVLPAAA